MGIFISSPKIYISSVYKGLLLYAETVLPSLFPFFFLTFLLTHIDGIGKISKIFSPISKMYGLNDECAFVIMMSFLSGYPIGAKLTEEYEKASIISPKQAFTLSAVASTSGPVFVIGTVGAMMLDNPRLGAIVYMCHILGALINGFLYKRGKYQKTQCYAQALSSNDLLKEAVYSSVISILCVGGFIAISSFVIEILKNFGVIDFISKCLFFIKDPTLSNGIAVSLFEMTNGIHILKNVQNTRLLLPAVTFAVTFGGASILLQCYAYLSSVGLKFSSFLLQKTTEALIASVIAFIISFLF